MDFYLAELPMEQITPEALRAKFNLSEADAKAMSVKMRNDRVFLSRTHQVNMHDPGGDYLHLSIKRIDKEAEHDWRILQDIKNSLCGPESEAVELYPAESRLIDTSNQYHLWVFKGERKFDIGWFEGRSTLTHEQASAIGAKQRDY